MTWFRLKQAIVDLPLWFLNAKVLSWDLVMFVLLKLLLVVVGRWLISFEGIVLEFLDLEYLLWLCLKRLLLGILNSDLQNSMPTMSAKWPAAVHSFCDDFLIRPYRWSWIFITFERIIVRLNRCLLTYLQKYYLFYKVLL